MELAIYVRGTASPTTVLTGTEATKPAMIITRMTTTLMITPILPRLDLADPDVLMPKAEASYVLNLPNKILEYANILSEVTGRYVGRICQYIFLSPQLLHFAAVSFYRLGQFHDGFRYCGDLLAKVCVNGTSEELTKRG